MPWYRKASRPQNYGLDAVYYKLDCWLKKRRFKEQACSASVAELYRHPLPASNQKVKDSSFLVIDCEMTGLNPNTHSLISIGWVEVRQMQLQLSSAQHFLIDSGAPVGKSATIHGILDRHMGDAYPMKQVLQTLCEKMPEKVAVFHHANLDTAFIQRAARSTLGCPMHLACIDTMQIEKRRLDLKNQTASLQLAACRERYNLPAAQEHNALADACATAELLLAQCAHMGDENKLRLGDLGIRCF